MIMRIVPAVVYRLWWLSWLGCQSINSKVEGSNPALSHVLFWARNRSLDKNAHARISFRACTQTSIFGMTWTIKHRRPNHWNGQMEVPSRRETPILWNSKMDWWNGSDLAASHTSEDEAFYAFLSGIEEGGLCPKTFNWMWGLAGSAYKTEGDHLKHWKVGSSYWVYNAYVQ